MDLRILEIFRITVCAVGDTGGWEGPPLRLHFVSAPFQLHFVGSFLTFSPYLTKLLYTFLLPYLTILGPSILIFLCIFSYIPRFYHFTFLFMDFSIGLVSYFLFWIILPWLISLGFRNFMLPWLCNNFLGFYPRFFFTVPPRFSIMKIKG